MTHSIYDLEGGDMDVFLDKSRVRIGRYVPTPTVLQNMVPLSFEASTLVAKHRAELYERFVDSTKPDPRLLAIVGPCSLDAGRLPCGKLAVVEYAERLVRLSQRPDIASKLQIVIRCAPAKPRTSIGRRGLEQTALEMAYRCMVEVAETGIPLTMEVMRELHYRRYGHLLSMAWVGARNVEDTFLRHMVSYYSDMPTLFKNANRAGLDEACYAIATAAERHWVEITTDSGAMREVFSKGNHATGLIFRGWEGITPPEYEDAIWSIGQRKVVDCSHTNARMFSAKATGQLEALSYLTDLIRSNSIEGIMLESYLHEGCESTGRMPGVSRTDPCLSWEQTEAALYALAELVPTRYK